MKTEHEVLNDLFPGNIDSEIAARIGNRQLSPAELDFCARCRARRDYLEKNSKEEEYLMERFPWSKLLKDSTEYIIQHNDFLVANGRIKRKRQGTILRSISISNTETPLDDSTQKNSEMASEVSGSRAHTSDVHETGEGTYSAKKAFDPNQSTAEIYEEAKVMANRTPAAAVRKSNTSGLRRAWTKEEEQALLDGLDAVKGPYWSQILGLYGQGGSVSEILKDRSQVQLKDKARNLKLFFLKSNLQVPPYLKCVTGDLKSRTEGTAASRAARQARGRDGGSPLRLEA